MGKRARKTRWRALDIADEHSDSEESNTNSSAVSSRYSRSNGYYSKFSNSSQSTPARRRYNQYDGSTKSTRSSSTTSETKITFNEDEYTRITTPRQDVLFKKGYLNKPKTYHNQTSTGNSTISTGNSTENGTPDHQSADLEYESQFVFPNGFVDQNGIYYVNSYEPYPLMLFNPPTYYQEFTNSKSKRYSTGSLSESMSPNNEEVTSQDYSQSGGEASNGGVSDYNNGAPPVFNMVYTGYYVNDVCPPTDNANGHHYTGEPVKKLRKRKERKSSKTIPGDSSEYTDENSDNERTETLLNVPQDIKQKENCAERSVPTQPNDVERVSDVPLKTVNENSNSIIVNHNDHAQKTDDQAQDLKTSSTLKADAEEFIPRGFQPLAPPPNLKILPPNFMPIPLVPLGAPHPAAFIPPGFPINFIPQPMGQKMFPPTPNFVPYPPPVVPEQATESLNEVAPQDTERESTATPSHTPTVDDGKTLQVHSKTIDIATVVSKLEAVKLERHGDATKAVINESKPFRNAPRLGSKPPTFKKHYYNNNKFRNSPVRSGDATPGDAGSPQHFRLSPARSVQNVETTNSSHQVKPEQNITERQQKVRSWKNHESPIKRYNNPMYQRSPEKTPTPVRNNVQPFRKSFLLNGQNKKPEESKPVPVVEQPKTETTKLKPNSQWISVSSRKKKKNKSVDGEIDNDDHEAPTCDESSDLFETYDVNQLVDVVPPLKEDDKTIEEILISMAPQAEVSKPLDIVIPEVREIERTLLDKVVEEVEPTETKEPQIVNTKTPQIKKSKKGTQKPLLKKVIITDIFKEPETPVIEAPTKKTVAAPIENTKVTVEKEVTPEPESEPQDKKPKRKKNKSKSSKTNSSSDQTTKEDTSYLLINEELTLEKTNDEISLELDQLIQKGMYSSLQEKIKTINVEPDMDAFFKTMGVGAKPAPVMKAPDFNRIFQSTRQFLKPNMTLPIRPLDMF